MSISIMEPKIMLAQFALAVFCSTVVGVLVSLFFPSLSPSRDFK